VFYYSTLVRTCKEEEIVFPFGAQAAATSVRVLRAGILVPLYN